MKHKFTFFSMLVQREIWENKGIFIKTPLVLASILIILSLFGTFNIITNDHALELNDWYQTYNQNEETTQQVDIADKKNLLIFFYGPTMLISFLLSLLYLSQSLHSDRKDRSVFFWRSLPIKESESVLIKLTTGILIYPCIFFFITTIAIFISTAIAYIGASIIGAESIVKIVAQEIQVFSFTGALHSIFSILTFAILFLPIFTWPLFCSAFAKRTPFMMALFFPLAVFFAEFIAFKSVNTAILIRDFLTQQLTNTAHIVSGEFSQVDGSTIVISCGLSITMILAAIWLRNNRFEI